MSGLWTTAAFGMVAAALALFTSWRRRTRPESLGAVSDHWIAEHRFGSGQDSRR